MRRRMIEKEGEKYPFYSDYPTITEYGTYIFDSQSDETRQSNIFLKMDNTPHNWVGGAPISMDLHIVYTKEEIIIRDARNLQPWINIKQESSRFSLKRCSGTENDPALVTFKIDKVS